MKECTCGEVEAIKKYGNNPDCSLHKEENFEPLELESNGYSVRLMGNGNFWFSKDGGEGMEMSKASMDKFWKDNF